MAILLKPSGHVSIEFPHLLELLLGNQFDTIYHEHYSYIGLATLQLIAGQAGLQLMDVEKLPTHGGSLRVWLARRDVDQQPSTQAQARIDTVLAAEAAAGLWSVQAFRGFQQRAEATKHALLRFLLEARQRGETVLGYGAAAKGNTLLNYAGVRADLLPVVADKATSKIGRFLPGSHIPVLSPEQWLALQPSQVLVLPWNLAAEVKASFQANPEMLFYRAIPTLESI
ncbi:methyltransferase C-terminal domain-containing protein [Cyanobium sp. LEGE 06113]|uniref:methyltransferase C-terminal domain-containing protein n=1 Tax=Cyanobium sp. LEGE 06113 TaxID=1297573 RepID=UPI001882243E|nr:methyltransferase C-terminal domain-containing protein [Cyanobium sp. LEGE 06113]MBE9154086.1 hypothetical protein [Cyanobium sp. LEGE 06113]